ncbi:MAG: hypothetical protein ABIC39_02055 [Pseudomonadota bacterium]
MGIWAISCYSYVGFFLVMDVVFVLVFTIGGFFGLLHMLRELKKAEVDETDNGRMARL